MIVVLAVAFEYRGVNDGIRVQVLRIELAANQYQPRLLKIRYALVGEGGRQTGLYVPERIHQEHE